MANVLVTGGAGYIGSVCCAELLRLGHSVTVVDDLSTGHRDAVSPEATFVQLEIGEQKAIESLATRNRFDAVFHFAAKALIPESMRDPGIFFQRNVASGIAMLEALRSAGIKTFIFSSSAAVYGEAGPDLVEEDAPKNPLNAYGETKLIFEQILQWYASAYRWSVFAFRYFNAAGATTELGERHEPETHLVPRLLQAAAGELEFFETYGDDYNTQDGTCLRDFVHVLDIADAHIRALTRCNEPGMHVYNIGTGRSYSVREVCDAVAQVTGRCVPLRIRARRAGDPAVLCASPRRIMRELDWKPRYSLHEILESAWQWKRKPCGDAALPVSH